jgi:hypothetical protein
MALSSYAPRLRTAVVLCGAGTAGVYHAGVLRALDEAGVKIDVVAGHGAGVIGALGGAVDGGSALWSASSPWVQPRLQLAYRFRPALRVAAWGLLASLALLVSPLLVLVVATAVYGVAMLAGLANLPGVAAALVNGYTQLVGLLFDPPVLPTIVPRLTMLGLLCCAGVLAVSAWRTRRQNRGRRRTKGGLLWDLLGHPLDGREPDRLMLDAFWRITRGASDAAAPGRHEMGRQYVELVTENFGQPGFRELLVAVHDLDAKRDVALAILSSSFQQAFAARRVGAGPRESESIDLSTAAEIDRPLVVDALIAAQRVPAASAPHEVSFPLAHYWQGETHRWSDRPDLVGRLIDEVARIGVEQVILVTAAPPPSTPHDLRARPGDFRGRMGDALRAIETAAFQDAWATAATRFSGVFTIRPTHNPIGPFDHDGVYDESSDRRRPVTELLQQGHDDAYRQFIEPVVATGERVAEI